MYVSQGSTYVVDYRATWEVEIVGSPGLALIYIDGNDAGWESAYEAYNPSPDWAVRTTPWPFTATKDTARVEIMTICRILLQSLHWDDFVLRKI